MKKYKKTYAIFHLTEKHTVFYLGKTKVHVSFTGGIVTKKGVTPATFTTDDPIVQLAIENSSDFKKKAIKLWSQYPAKGEVKIGKNKGDAPGDKRHPETNDDRAPGDKQKEQAPFTGDKDKEDSGSGMESETLGETLGNEAEAGENKAKTSEESLEAGETDRKEEEAEPKTEESKLEVVEVSCKDVAKQYLQEHFNENPTPLRTIANVQECAAKYGITFSFV